MADEIQVNYNFSVNKGGLQYRLFPTAYLDDMAGQLGPTPGALVASEAGTDIDLSELTVPGWVVIRNLEDEDSSVILEWGIHDGSVFHPVGELLGGHHAVFKLSRNFAEEHTIPGTGTTGDVNQLRLKAYGGTCRAFVGAFEA